MKEMKKKKISMNKRHCEKCHKRYDEDELDIYNGIWICSYCEELKNG